MTSEEQRAISELFRKVEAVHESVNELGLSVAVLRTEFEHVPTLPQVEQKIEQQTGDTTRRIELAISQCQSRNHSGVDTPLNKMATKENAIRSLIISVGAAVGYAISFFQ